MGVAAEIVVISGRGVSYAHERTTSGKKKERRPNATSSLAPWNYTVLLVPRSLGLYHFFARPIRSLKGQGGKKKQISLLAVRDSKFAGVAQCNRWRVCERM